MPDAAPEFAAAWSRFQTLQRLRLIPQTLESEWTQGRDRYLALLIPIDDPQVIAHIRPTVGAITGIPGVEPYPEVYWHATVKGIGFLTDTGSGREEVSEAQLEAIAEAAGECFAAQPGFEATIGPANAFDEVVIMEVWDAGRIRALNTLLLERLPGVARYPFDGRYFLPHVSIARFSSDSGLTELKEVLAELRSEKPGAGRSFQVGFVDLIVAQLSEEAPRLEPLGRYELRGPR